MFGLTGGRIRVPEDVYSRPIFEYIRSAGFYKCGAARSKSGVLSGFAQGCFWNRLTYRFDLSETPIGFT